MKPPFVIACLLVVMLSSKPVAAQFDPQPHVIKVNADSEIKAIPDKVIIVLGVQSRDSVMNVARQRTDNMTRTAIGIAKKYGVPDNDISTEYYNVEPQYKTYDKQDFIGYRVYRRIVINLKNFDKYESLMNEFLENGIENVQSVQFKVSDQNKYIEQAIRAALKTAKAKADVIAAEMGVKLSGVYSVTETRSSMLSPNFGYAPDSFLHYRGSAMAMASPQEASTTFGYLNATANVTVSYEINR